MNIHARRTMTYEEFERWAERQERKHELVRGEPRMLPYVKFAHTDIANTVRALLFGQIDLSVHAIADGDFAIRTGPDSARFADAAIVLRDLEPDAGFTTEPIVVVEILSPSTMHEDFGTKRFEYQSLASLQAYLVLAQDKPQAWLWLRDDKGEWLDAPVLFEGRDGQIELAAAGAMLRMADVYRA